MRSPGTHNQRKHNKMALRDVIEQSLQRAVAEGRLGEQFADARVSATPGTLIVQVRVLTNYGPEYYEVIVKERL